MKDFMSFYDCFYSMVLYTPRNEKKKVIVTFFLKIQTFFL